MHQDRKEIVVELAPLRTSPMSEDTHLPQGCTTTSATRPEISNEMATSKDGTSHVRCGHGRSKSVSNALNSISDTNDILDSPSATSLTWQMDVVRQPKATVTLTEEVEIYVRVLWRTTAHIDYHKCYGPARLFAVVSLLACRGYEDCAPVDPHLMVTTNLFATAQIGAADLTETTTYGQVRVVPLGHFDFLGLSIRQAGLYRIRITLIHTPDPFHEHATTVAFVDSDPIEVKDHVDSTC